MIKLINILYEIKVQTYAIILEEIFNLYNTLYNVAANKLLGGDRKYYYVHLEDINEFLFDNNYVNKPEEFKGKLSETAFKFDLPALLQSLKNIESNV